MVVWVPLLFLFRVFIVVEFFLIVAFVVDFVIPFLSLSQWFFSSWLSWIFLSLAFLASINRIFDFTFSVYYGDNEKICCFDWLTV